MNDIYLKILILKGILGLDKVRLKILTSLKNHFTIEPAYSSFFCLKLLQEPRGSGYILLKP